MATVEQEDSEGVVSIKIKIFLSPNSRLTPGKLVKDLSSLNLSILVKEKCYGLLIHGEASQIERAISHLRAKHPYDVFIKGTAQKIKGSRIFSGFLQAAGEYTSLSLISQALRGIQAGNEAPDMGDLVWEAPPLDAEIYRSKMERCRYLPHRNIEVLLMYQKNGDVIVRCPSAQKYCVWGACASCPYGLLEHNLDRWYHRQGPTYWILRSRKGDGIG